MIFVDTNIPICLVGAEHPHTVDAGLLLGRLASSGVRLVTSAGVFQELLHRYVRLRRRDAIEDAFQSLLSIVDIVFPVDQIDVMRARGIVQASSALSARDALHLAVMERHGVKRILSFDADFDRWPGVERIWRV